MSEISNPQLEIDYQSKVSSSVYFTYNVSSKVAAITWETQYCPLMKLYKFLVICEKL